MPAAASAAACIDLTADSDSDAPVAPPAKRAKTASKAKAAKTASKAAGKRKAAHAGTASGSAIDLTTPAAAAAAAAAPVRVALRRAASVPIEDNTDVDECFYGNITTKIVGIRYYAGIVSDRENTKLRREPTNAYDRNAIQALNMGGEQVGHIPKEVASLLAVQMDAIKDDLRVEGYIPRGSGNVYSIPVQLSLYGPVSARAAMTKMLQVRLASIYHFVRRGTTAHTCPANLQALQSRHGKVQIHNPSEEAPPPPGAKKKSKKAKLAPTASEIVER